MFNLSYTGGGDTPDLELTAANTILTRTVVLPGGATLTRNYPTPAATAWHHPGIHGDNLLTHASEETSCVVDRDGKVEILALLELADCQADHTPVW